MQDAVHDTRTALALRRQCLDPGPIDGDEAELGRDEHTVGDDEQQDGQQTERSTDVVRLVRVSTNQVP